MFDARQRFVTSELYELPFGKGRRFLNRGIAGSVLGGWQLGSILSLSSSFPRAVTAGTDPSNTNNNFERTSVTGETVALPRGKRGPAQWFNIGAFYLQAPGTFGSGGRGAVTDPGVIAWDFSTLRSFNFTEKRYLQFRFEAFNLPNHPNWGNPGVVLGDNRLDAASKPIPGSGRFGAITSTRTPMRQLQFSLKMVF